MRTYTPQTSYIRVAAATPTVHLADVPRNVSEISLLYKDAAKNNVALVVFPELSVTGYSIGDLLPSPALLESALQGLQQLASLTKKSSCAMVVGMPIKIQNALYNCAALLADGVVKGIVPKINLPTYREFYEKRWFQSYQGPSQEVLLNSNVVPFGTDVLFEVAGTIIGIEICEDVWVADQPSIRLVNQGAHILCNLSASPEIATKAMYRRQLVANTSARLVAGYVYSGADPSESTMDVVFGGHALIYQAGRLLAERMPFSLESNRLIISDIDIDRINVDRIHDTNYKNTLATKVIKTNVQRTQLDLLQDIDATPFLPKGTDEIIAERLEEILTIQAFGLKKRLDSSGAKKVILGLSGGLDSTLALLVAQKTAVLRGIQPKDMILTLTMPGNASSGRTQNNATNLAKCFGIENRIVPINTLTMSQLSAIGHNQSAQDVTYENTQARLRTSLLFNTANSESGIVLGTGDLSEIALGWCTFNGDHMSAYNVNASIPKTLVRSLVRHAAKQLKNDKATAILHDILDTPVSPELTVNKDKELSQKTEDIIGPYELHDFFLYNFVRWMDSRQKIAYLAAGAFNGKYSEAEITKWLTVFLTRFASNQWKRSVMADGPKVGSVSLSPRGDWRMPSDIAKEVFVGDTITTT